jgi:hypothetical protein
MESLESRLDRLSPEQRREVEDFVDFLIQRSGTFDKAPPLPQASPPPLITVAPQPIPVQEPPAEPDPPKTRTRIRVSESPDPAPQEDPTTPLIQEIAPDDPGTNDYIDYGKYEPPPPSPATDAVKRVKEKISHKKVHETGNQILDWID